MVDGGNSYTLRYVNHVLNVTLDSSHYTYASEGIPFFGLVFHGYLNYAGAPTNMAGDVNYEILKIVESGASPYFLLAVRNIEKMKEDTNLSKYYSVSYENWKEDMGLIYHSVNAALHDVMYEKLVGHEFLIGERVKTDEEAKADEEAAKREEEEKAEAAETARKDAARRIRLAARVAKEDLDEATTELPLAQAARDAAVALQTEFIEITLPAANAALDAAKAVYDDAMAAAGDDEEAKAAAQATYDEAVAEHDKVVAAKAAADIAVRNAERALTKAQTAYDKAVLANDKAQADLKAMNDGGDPEEILAGDKKEETEEKPEEEGYQYTKYTSDNGMIVRVTYGNGVSFIINYNNFAVTVEGYTIGAYDGMKFNADGETVIESIRALTHGEAAAD